MLFTINSISPAEQITGVSSLLSSLTTYNLNVSGNNYTLTNGATSLLSGLLRDYTTATGFGSDVYRTSNFVFLGDDTISARANIDLKSITITNNTAGVPYEFSPTAGILALVAGSIINHLLKKKKS
ncbi:PFE-CTERM domain-containing protein [Nostoc sp.]